jgi:flagellar assembly protein FliH
MLTLEDFGAGVGAPGQTTAANTGASNGLGAFEDGYKAGWDDAVHSVQQETTAISAELGRNIEELSVTFFEARRQVCLSLRPFIDAVSGTILPALIREHVADALSRYVEEALGEEVAGTAVLVVSETDVEAVSSRIPSQEHLDVEVRVEPSFAPGQIRLVLGDESHEVDHSRLLENVQKAVADFYANMAEDSKVG